MKSFYKKLTGIALGLALLAGVIFVGQTDAFADVTANFWQKASNGQLYTNSGNGAGNAVINVAGCNGCGGGGGGGGTVSSVGLALPTDVFNISGSPVSTSGTLTGSFDTQLQNLIFASPDGSTGVPTFRALTANDLPGGTGNVTGSGTTNQMTFWSGTNSISGAANITRTPYSLVVGTGSLNANIFIGDTAGNATVSGTNDVGMGFGAGLGLTSGSSNTFIGSGSGVFVTSGNSNTFVGRSSGGNIFSGSQNTMLGQSASAETDVSNSIAIGYGSRLYASNQLVIGDSSSRINDVYIGAGVTSSTASATSLTLRTSGGGNTDSAGQNMRIRPGAGTGNAVGGKFSIDIALPGSSGSTANSYTNMLLVDATGLTTLARSLALTPVGTGTGQTGEIRSFELVANGTSYTGFKAPDSLAGNVIYSLPIADGTAGQLLSTNGTGALSWAAGGVTGTGTTNKLAYWSSASVVDAAPDFTMDVGTGYLMTTGAFAGVSGSGSNAAGGVLNVQGGQSTGNASGGELRFLTSEGGASGSTPNSMRIRQSIDSVGTVKIGDVTGAGNNTLLTISDVAQTILADGTLSVLRGLRLNNTSTSVDITLTESDTVKLVMVTPVTGPITVRLPLSPVDGQYYVIKDGTGGSNSDNITIDGQGNTIDNASTYVINTSFGSVTLIFNSTLGEWFLI